MHSPTMPSQDVRLSHAGIESFSALEALREALYKTRLLLLLLNSYTYPQSILVSSTSTILVFPHQTGWEYSDRDSLTVALNARGYEKSRFSTNISLYLASDAR